MLTLVSNIIVVALLGVAIFYMVKLRKELRVLKQGRDQLEYASHNLLQSVESAKQAISGLRANVDEKGSSLQERIDEAQKLFDELTFIYDSANSLANRLEKLASNATAAAGLKKTENLTKSESQAATPTRAEKSDKIESGEAKSAQKDKNAPAPPIKPKSRAEATLLAAMRKKKQE